MTYGKHTRFILVASGSWLALTGAAMAQTASPTAEELTRALNTSPPQAAQPAAPRAAPPAPSPAVQSAPAVQPTAPAQARPATPAPAQATAPASAPASAPAQSRPAPTVPARSSPQVAAPSAPAPSAPKPAAPAPTSPARPAVAPPAAAQAPAAQPEEPEVEAEAPPPPPVRLIPLNAAAVAALPFHIDLGGAQIVERPAGPGAKIYSVSRIEKPLLMIYAGPRSDYPIYDGQQAVVGDRVSVIVSEGINRRAVEHLFRREGQANSASRPTDIHVWLIAMDGPDGALAERIGQTVDPR